MKLLKYLPYVLLFILGLFFLHNCQNHEKEVQELNKDWNYKEQMYLHNESTLIRDTTEKGEELVTQKALYITEKQKSGMLQTENRSLKKLVSEVKVTSTSSITNAFVLFDTIYDIGIDNNNETKEVKQIFRVNNEWYGINGKILSNGVLFDSIYFNNELVVSIGYKKDKGLKNFFKRPYPVVEVINKNPYSSINTVHNVVIKPRKKKFVETKAFQIGVGVAAGFYLGIRAIR